MERQTHDKILTFGKHKGKSIAQICEQEPSYIVWCILNIPEFYIYSDDLKNEFSKHNYVPSDEFWITLKIKDEHYYSNAIADGYNWMHAIDWHQTFEPKAKNDKSLYKAMIEKLNNNWEIVCSDMTLFQQTFPKKFTGNKGRRLVVKKKMNFTPPWGSWYDHLKNGKPSKFTELRKKINELINPMEIDHIDFID